MEQERPPQTPDEQAEDAKRMQERLDDERLAESQYREHKRAMLKETQERLHDPFFSLRRR